MNLSIILNALKLRSTNRPLRRTSATLLRLEPLEDRWVPTFAISDSTQLGQFSSLALAADFNNDLVPDLARRLGGTVDVLLGNGDGTFRTGPSTSIGFLRNGGTAAGDFNLDGNIDLAFAIYYDSQVGFPAVALGNGDGTFQGAQFVSLQIPPPPLDAWLVSFYTTQVAVADFNVDGNPDLMFICDGTALANSGEAYYPLPATAVALGNGNGGFTSLFTALDQTGWAPFGNIAAEDLNADGKVDVVGANGARYGRGDGTLTDWQAFSPDQLGFNVAVNDFNGDGRLDVAATTSPLGNQGGFVRLNNGNGTFQPPQSYVSGPNPAELAAADFNGDGKTDLVTLNAGSDPSLTVSLGNGNGTFQGPLSFATSPGGGKAGGMAMADFNGDGRSDVTVRASNYPAWDHNLRVLLNDGNWSPPQPSITIGDATVTEGNTGMRAASFTVTLSEASSRPVTVAYATANGTAMAFSDYQAVSGTLTIPAGQTTGTITVLVNGDRLGEANETFFVNLSGTTNATIGLGQAVGTILDDEPRISIGDVTKQEGKKGRTTLFVFTVTLSTAYDQPVTMSFRTVNGTAKTSDNDYVAKTGTLTFAPGETTKTITIEVKGDSKRETSETFYLDLFGNSGNALFTDSSGLGTILNDD